MDGRGRVLEPVRGWRCLRPGVDAVDRGAEKTVPRGRRRRAPRATRCPRAPTWTAHGQRSTGGVSGRPPTQEAHRVSQETPRGVRGRHRRTGRQCPRGLGECGDHSCHGSGRHGAQLPGWVRRPDESCHRVPVLDDVLHRRVPGASVLPLPCELEPASCLAGRGDGGRRGRRFGWGRARRMRRRGHGEVSARAVLRPARAIDLCP